jgi:3-hydroxypropanoate dehydrogenase
MQLAATALDQIFRTARTFPGFLDRPVTLETLREIYDLMKWGPTTMNTNPCRIVYVISAAAKQKLAPALSAGNLNKTMAAPATAILAYDLEFYEKLPKLFPQTDGRSVFAGKPELIATAALRNASMQGGYFIMAARALGLDCGPMSGFDNAKVDAAFFPDGKIKSNFLCNFGYGDPTSVKPRNPRLSFDEACRIE